MSNIVSIRNDPETSRVIFCPKVVAIGESGLDTYWDRAPLSLQREYLERHVEPAGALEDVGRAREQIADAGRLCGAPLS